MGHSPILQAELPVTELDRWLNEIMAMTGLERLEARRAFGAVSRGLASRLPSSEASLLIDQMPSAVRQQMGYELEPRRGGRDDLADEVAESCPALTHQQVERAIWAVLTLLSHHYSPQWVRHVRVSLPTKISTMWNTAA